MFRKILIPTDGSELSEKAITAAVDFARQAGATLVAISVAEPNRYVPPATAGLMYGSHLYSDLQLMLDEQSQHIALDNAQKVVNAAQLQGVICEVLTPISPTPHEEIVAAVERYGCDAVFMASHGRKGLNKLFLGSETQKVLAHTSVPVMVFR